jgi:hypothetical protein
LIVDPKHPDRQPVVLITDGNGNRRRLRIDEVTNYRRAPARSPAGCCGGSVATPSPAPAPSAPFDNNHEKPPSLGAATTLLPTTGGNGGVDPQKSTFHSIGINDESKTPCYPSVVATPITFAQQQPHPYVRYADPAVPPVALHFGSPNNVLTNKNPPAYAPHPGDSQSSSTSQVPDAVPVPVHRNSAPSAVLAPGASRQPAVYVMYPPLHYQHNPKNNNNQLAPPAVTAAASNHQRGASYPPPSTLSQPYVYGQYITSNAETPRYGTRINSECSRCHTKLTLPMSMAHGQLIQCPKCSGQWMY